MFVGACWEFMSPKKESWKDRFVCVSFVNPLCLVYGWQREVKSFDITICCYERVEDVKVFFTKAHAGVHNTLKFFSKLWHDFLFWRERIYLEQICILRYIFGIVRWWGLQFFMFVAFLAFRIPGLVGIKRAPSGKTTEGYRRIVLSRACRYVIWSGWRACHKTLSVCLILIFLNLEVW